jgi:hypothetical protein
MIGAVGSPTPAERATAKWTDAEFYLGTDQGRPRWDRFWTEVRAGRRVYALLSALFGALAAAAVAGEVLTVATRPTRHLPQMALAYLSALPLAWVWGRVLSATIAPLLLRNGQRMARVAFVAAQTLVLALGPLLAGARVAWAVIAAVLVALPWWTSAYLESHRPVPAYPDEWKGFTTG